MLGAATGYAADEDEIPSPISNEDPSELRSAPEPKPQAAIDDPLLPSTDEMPSPSLGEEQPLPEPAGEKSQEAVSNPVNQYPLEDDSYLPLATGRDSNINYAPADRYAPNATVVEAEDYNALRSRPIFSLYGGAGFKAYPNSAVNQNNASGTAISNSFFTGPTVGASVRFFDISQTVFAHIYADYSWYSLGDVGTGIGSVAQVHDETMHIGPILEIGIGRRFSIFGSLLRRQARISSDPIGVTDLGNQNKSFLDNLGERPSWHLGVGAQLDFYVIPHGSLGVNFRIEENLYQVTLAFAIEPVPRKKLNLNYDDMN